MRRQVSNFERQQTPKQAQEGVLPPINHRGVDSAKSGRNSVQSNQQREEKSLQYKVRELEL